MDTKAIDMQEKCRRLVQREVHYCVSTLVSTLAQGNADMGERTHGRALGELTGQALDLCMPIPDYEEAATDAGWYEDADGDWVAKDQSEESGYRGVAYDDAQECCDSEGIDPYDREVFEHWIVSDWLAGKLEKQGEKVDRDFAGLTVWARTTTGQAICLDSCIEQIVQKLEKANAA